ncbi:MAG: xanthine permease [Clostridiales bacterium]|jgi:uracil permease|nr:xanthine permease [Clostridiales bacterium]
MASPTKAAVYLPDEKPAPWKLMLYALQQVVVMFPATVTVALITGFQVSTTIFASGLATLCFIMITGRKIPLYYGSSFSYLSAVIGLMTSETVANALTADELSQLNGFLNGEAGFFAMPQSAIEYAQVGIVMSGLVSIAAGLVVKFAGIKAIEKVLPPTITGPIAMIIGLTLAGNALSDAAPKALADGVAATVFNSNWVWVVSLVTLLSTIIYSRYLKGFLGQLPLLLGAATGCLAAVLIYRIGGSGYNLFRAISGDAIESIYSFGPFAVPKFSFPNFSNPQIARASIAAIMPIAIATIPESTAHMYQLDIYVNNAASKKKSSKKYKLIESLHLNLIGDGIGDMITGIIGGPAGTNYGENISTMAITKVFSVPVLIAAAIIAMFISCFTPLIQVIYGIPLAVIGGLEIYLFGAIAAQGIAILIDKKADMFSSANIAVIASIMVIGIGGQYVYGGNIPFFGINVPCIAGAAIFGIALNLLLSIGSGKEESTE